MFGITENELQRVRARRKVDLRLCLSPAEMQMMFIRRDRYIKVQFLVHINEQMMMTGVGSFIPGLGPPCCASQSDTRRDSSPVRGRSAR